MQLFQSGASLMTVGCSSYSQMKVLWRVGASLIFGCKSCSRMQAMRATPFPRACALAITKTKSYKNGRVHFDLAASVEQAQQDRILTP